MNREFNDLLREAGIAPKDVTVIRHHTPERGQEHATLHELWRDDPAGFTRYQATQRKGQPKFRNRKIWAAFACPAQDDTMFLGLFDAELKETRRADWLCNYRGDAPGDGEEIDLFTTQPRQELAEHIGFLRVDWPSDNRRTWARKAEGLGLPISAVQPAESITLLAGESLIAALEQRGFVNSHMTKKLAQLRRGDLVVYVKRKAESRPLVLHPRFLDIADDLRMLARVDVADPARPYINSNLRAFPVYLADHRVSAGRYGFAIGLPGDQLGPVIDLVDRSAKVETPEGEVRVVAPEDDPLTERERLQAARVGQGDFRNALMILWNGTCPVAGVDHAGLLRASHIKAWKASTNVERLDPFNGLLLCAHIDALFDRHLITFEDDGWMLVSAAVTKENRTRLGLVSGASISGLNSRHAPYLAHHRKLFQA